MTPAELEPHLIANQGREDSRDDGDAQRHLSSAHHGTGGD
jgi:hypothetical protein